MKKVFIKIQIVVLVSFMLSVGTSVFAQTDNAVTPATPVTEQTNTGNPPNKKKHLFNSPTTKKKANPTSTVKTGEKVVTEATPNEEKFVQISKTTPTEIAAANEENAEKIDASSVVASSSPEGAGLVSRPENTEVKTEPVRNNPENSELKGENTGVVGKPREFAVSANLSALREKIAIMQPTEIYKVGAGDVLDIRLLNTESTESTLYTVLEGGILDFPLAGEILNVKGLTTEEIDLILTERIKLYDNPEVTVSVRDFASHKITILGAVEKAGAKSLRREAVPLYVALAEAVPNADATNVTIIRANKKIENVKLDDSTTLLQAGDVVRISSGSTKSVGANQFFYIIGAVNSAGQKEFHQGLTLTQAVFAAGGLTKNSGNRVVVMRQNPEGLLVTLEYNLKQIREGKVPDPTLQAGDRIEVGN